eukprot:CAMPEP_0118990326 /NCGR_PEP_ID=MMETSP1173-20130426/49712_1 /TAXON_ID=1034831 /ORGANISM="Rhizochromulina marina cf, Strain CCMP1243" /LENGTH=65 /DNA_ID=CAMNT_0006941375 /DNA_START=106 /DNA_END=299 /DNA_ORIENTATION=-
MRGGGGIQSPSDEHGPHTTPHQAENMVWELVNECLLAGRGQSSCGSTCLDKLLQAGEPVNQLWAA